MKFLYVLTLITPSIVIANSTNIIEWKKFQIPYRYNIIKDIKDHKKCKNPNTTINEILTRNKINSINDIKMADSIELPVCNGIESMYISPPTEEPIRANSEHIRGWDEKITPKGYQLSADLSDNQGCAKIWTKQIYEFQKKNPTVDNPNNIPMNKKIFVQRCYDIVQGKEAKDEKEKAERIEVEKAINDYLVKEGRFDLYLGTSSFNKDLIHVLGVGVRGPIFENHGYELKLFNFGSSLMFIGEFEMKDSNYRFQKTLTIGVSEYFLNEEFPARSGTTAYATVGFISRPSEKFVAELEIGANFSGQLGPVIQTNAMKKFGKDTWIGLFLEARSLKNPNHNDRDNLILSGLKLSF